MNQPASPEPLHPRLHLGTSSWSTKDWDGVFYPKVPQVITHEKCMVDCAGSGSICNLMI